MNLTGATTAKITTQAWYDIEEGYDFLYGEVSTDDGATWTKIGTEVDGISGGGDEPVWIELSYDLDAYAGQNVKFRFRYQTDGGVHYAGPFLDDIALVTNGTGWTDDVEAGTGAWTANGFTRMTGSTSRQAEHFYLAEYRSYTGYDKNFKTGPYNFIAVRSGLGGEVPVPGRHAGVVRQLCVLRQQHHRPPWRRSWRCRSTRVPLRSSIRTEASSATGGSRSTRPSGRRRRTR